MPSYKSVVFNAEQALKTAELEVIQARLLLFDLFDVNHTWFMLHENDKMSIGDIEQYELHLKRILNGEPFQYVVGFSHFYGNKFKVTPNTLIPRNETEELVDLILKKEPYEGLSIVDVGTGTGAIALSLSQYMNNEIYMTDISAHALKVAIENRNTLNVSATALHGDVLDPLIEHNIKVDVIVSNPPYISLNESHLMTPTTAFEPSEALFAEDNGLYFYKNIINNAHKVLCNNGRVYFEIGFNQKESIIEYIKEQYPLSTPVALKDINGKDRIIYFKVGD